MRRPHEKLLKSGFLLRKTQKLKGSGVLETVSRALRSIVFELPAVYVEAQAFNHSIRFSNLIDVIKLLLLEILKFKLKSVNIVPQLKALCYISNFKIVHFKNSKFKFKNNKISIRKIVTFRNHSRILSNNL